MSSLSRSDIQKIERYWIENGRRSKYAISDKTAKKAMLLANDDYYQNLKCIIKTVEDLYNELDDDMRTIEDMRYWDTDGCYEWEDIADKLYISRNKVLRKRNILSDKTGYEHIVPMTSTILENTLQQNSYLISEVDLQTTLIGFFKQLKAELEDLIEDLAHRYCEDNYPKNILDENVLNQFLDEELELIGKIVRLIIKETNELLEICHMDYDGKEISYGVLNMDVIEKESHI